MSRLPSLRARGCAMLVGLVGLGLAGSASAEFFATSPSRTVGPFVNGQVNPAPGGGWQATDDRIIGAGLVGQGGWSGACSPQRFDEEIVSGGRDGGGQAWRISNWYHTGCVNVVISPEFAPVGEGGATTASGGAGNPALSNRVVHEFWFRHATGSVDPGTFISTTISDAPGRRMTYLGIFDELPNTDSDCANEAVGCFHVAASGVTNGDVDGDDVAGEGDVAFDWHASPDLARDRWYRVVVDATFNDGKLNDQVSYTLFDAEGVQVWAVGPINSWEDAYLEGQYGAPVGDKVASDHVAFRISANADDGSQMPFDTYSVANRPRGVLIDELSVTPTIGAAYATSFEANRYVDAATGTDDSDCTVPGDPCLTIQYAIAQSDDGDTIHVAAGLYSGAVAVNKRLRIFGATVAAAAKRPAAALEKAGPTQVPTTVIDGGNAAGDGIFIANGMDNVTLAGLEVRNFQGHCVHGGGATDALSLSQNLIHHCGQRGIYLEAAGDLQDVTIDSNEVHTISGDRGIVIWDGNKRDITITNNYVHGVTGCCGIELQDGAAAGAVVTDNVVENTGDSGMAFVQLTAGSPSGRANLIARNTVTNTGRFGIEVKIPNGNGALSGDGAIVIEDNLIDGDGAKTLRDRAGIAVHRRSFNGVAYPFQVDVTAGVVVRNNTVQDFQTIQAGHEGFGILVEGLGHSASGNVLSGNDVELQVQAGNDGFPGDSNQESTTAYFSRGNAQSTCAAIGTNTVDSAPLFGATRRVDTRANSLPMENNVVNENTGEIFCSLQAAIDDTDTVAGHVIRIADGAVLAEQVVIHKSLRLTQAGSGTLPTIVAPNSVADLALFRVAAANVEIDHLAFVVDLSVVGEAIRSVGNTPGGEPDGLSIHDNTITATSSAPAFVGYGRRNAISLNMSSASGYAPPGEQVTTLTVDVRNNTIGGTQDWDAGTGGNQPAYFRSAIAIDQGEGSIANNSLRGRDYDVFARFTNGAGGLDIGFAGQPNTFAGGGLYLGDGITSVRVTGNTFAPDRSLLPFADFPPPTDAAQWGDLGTHGARLVNVGPVVLTGNTFSDHSNSVFAQNFADLDLANNVFTAPPEADQAEFRHLILSTKVVSTGSASVTQVPLAISASGNSFNGGSAAQTAIAVELINHDADNDQYGAIGFADAFAGDFDFYFRLDPQVGGSAPSPYSIYYAVGSAPATTIAPFGGDVNAQASSFGGVSPAAMDYAQYQAIQTRTYHDDPNAPESPAAPAALGIVNYGFAPNLVPTTTAVVSTAPNPSAIGADVTVTVSVTNALGGVPTGDVSVTAPDSAGCTITAYTPSNNSCDLIGGFSAGGGKLVTASFAPTAGSVNQPSSGSATHFVSFGPGTVNVTPTPTPSAFDNDYTRINNAIQSAAPGVIIELDGDFNWLEPNAFASWQAGSNGVGGEGHLFATGGDDWSVRLPAGVNGVIVRAAVGGASVQGSEGDPGNLFDDLAAFAIGYGDNQNWTFQGLTLRGFDIGIGMFVPDYNSAERFNGTQYLGNTIEIGPDSGDAYGNYGIYAGYGESQAIAGNAISIDITGADGTTPAPNSRSIGIQIGDSSNTDAFDGLLISANQIAVSGIPTVAPRVIGIWENAGDANSSITIEDNQFAGSGDLGGGVAANNQTAFIATTQSNGTRMSAFRGNTATSAAIGLRSQLPIYGHYVVSDSPLQIEGNTFLGNGTALRLHGAYPNAGQYTLRHNRIFGNEIGLFAERADDLPLPGDPGYGGDELPTLIDADDNWWGCNAGPADTACDSIEIEAGADPAVVTQATWLQLRTVANPTTVVPPAASAITLDLVSSSDGTTVASGFPDDTDIDLTTSKATLNPAAPLPTSAGVATTSLEGLTSGVALLEATLDNQSIDFSVIVAGPVTVNDAPNAAELLPAGATCGSPDFSTIQAALDFMPAGSEILVCAGSYPEILEIEKAVAIRGAQAGVAGVSQSGAESVVTANASDSGEVVVYVLADDVTLDGLTVDGNNPAIDSTGINDIGGVDVDFGYGVYAFEASALELRNSVVRNVFETAFYGYGNEGDNLFERNLVSNAGGRGVIAANSYYIAVRDNRFDAVRVGVQTNNTWQANPGAIAGVIEDNVFNASSTGVFHNLFYAGASPWAIRNNLINATQPAGVTGQWRGIWVESMQSAQTVSIENNLISAAAVPVGPAERRTIGYLLNNVVTTAPLVDRTILGGDVSNVDVGVLSTDAAFYTGPVDDFAVAGVVFSNIGFASLYVEDTTDNPGSARLTIGAGNDFSAQGTAHSLALSGATASVGGQTVADVFVRSARDFYFGAQVAGPPNTGVTPCFSHAVPDFCPVASAVVNTGVAAANVGGTVTLEAGQFAQNVTVNKSVTLQGPHAGVAGDDGARGTDEAIIAPAAGTALAFSANDVVVDGIEFGPISHDRIVTKTGGGTRTGVQLVNNRFVDFTSTSSNGGGFIIGGTSGLLVEGNLFEDFANGAGFAMGIKLDGNTAPVVQGNVFRRVESVAMQFSQATGATVSGNIVDGEVSGFTNAGVQVFTSSSVNISGNVFNGTDYGLLFMRGNSDLRFTCNTVSLSGVGIRAAIFGTVGPEASPAAFHNVLPANTAVQNDWGSPLFVGSNYYGGGSPTSAGAQPSFVADALLSTPIGDANCGDNTAVELVLYAPSGSGQSADLNQPFGDPLRARVQDALGGAVMGESVTFTAPSAGASALLTPTSGTTQASDFNGVVETTAIANGFAGTYDVVAAHSTNPVAFNLTNVALQQVQFDLNGPVAGVEVGDTVAYTGFIGNENPNVTENVYVHVEVAATVALDPADLAFCVLDPLPPNACIPLTWTDNGATLSLDFTDLSGFPITAPYQFLHNFRAVFGKAGVYTVNADIVGATSGTIYASDLLSTEVIAQHAGVELDVTGPVAGVEKDAPAAYIARLSNSAAAVADNVIVEFILTRTGGIQAGDVTVEYDTGGGVYQVIPLFDAGGQLEAAFGPPGGFALPSGYDQSSLFRVTYHVAPHTFTVAATVIDAAGNSDGVPTYAADNLSTDVIEADPDVDLTLSGLFDLSDGTTLVAPRVADPAILRAELVNTGGNVPDLVLAAFTIAPDFTGLAATDIVASYGFVPIGDSCGTASFTETVVFSVAGDNLTATTDPQPLPEDFELAVCFRIEFLQPGVYNIGAVIEDAGADTDAQSEYAADNLAVTVAESDASVTLAGLGSFVFDGGAHAASATTTPVGLTVEIEYVYDNGVPSTTVPVEAGAYQVTARIADGQGYSGVATGTITITPKPLTIALGGAANGTYTYDGNAQVATATVTGVVGAYPLPLPAGQLAVSYNGSPTAPTDVGAYAVSAYFNDASAIRNYSALPAVGNIAIVKAVVPVTIDSADLLHVFDGNPQVVDASFTLPPPPAAQSVAVFEVTYDGSTTPPSAVGSYSVVATIYDGNYEGSASATLNIVSAPLQSVTLTANDSTAIVDTDFGTGADDDLCALVLDINGDPAVDIGVTFSAPTTGASAVLSATLVQTDVNGEACIAATANTIAGSYAVTANVGGGLSDSENLSNEADADPTQVELVILAGNGLTAPVGTAFSPDLEVAASDRFGNVLIGAAYEPAFAAPMSEPTAVLSGATDADANGAWVVSATAGAFAGSYAVTAELDVSVCDAGSANSVCVVNFGLSNTAEAPASVALFIDSDGVVDDIGTPGSFDDEAVVGTPGGAYELSAEVRDASNATVAGVSVTFVIEPNALNGAGTTQSNVVALTDAFGVARASFAANERAREFTARAVVSGVVADGNDAQTLTNLAAAAAALEIAAGDNQSVAVNTAFQDLVVRVVDAFGNAVAGESVAFTANAVGGASASLAGSPATSDINGLASVQATANDTAGAYTVTAASGVLASVDFNLANTLGAITISNIRWAANDLISVGYGAADQNVSFDTAPATDPADCNLSYNGTATLPRDAGTYLVQVSCSNAGFSGTASATLSITKADSGITVAGGSFVFDGVPKPAVVTNPNVAAFTLSYSGSGPTTYGPTSTPPVNAGSYLASLVVNDPNYEEAAALTAAIEITPADVTVSFGNLAQIYDGTAKTASVTTSPAGVAGVSLSYAPDAAPTNAGDYTVTAALSNGNYVLSGPTTATLVIEKATAQVTLSDLTRIFDGTPKPVTVNTTPAGLGVNLSYDGGATAPSAVGSYAVVATVADLNYQGSASGTLTILAAAVSQFVIDSATPVDGIAGAPLAASDLPRVRVLDNTGAGVAGISIVFDVASGGGSATGTSATTDAEGRATVGSWTLGADAGANTMTARVNGLAGLPTLTFTANGAEQAGVALDKSSATTQANPGDAVTYSIVVTHVAGTSNAAAVEILDSLPAGLDVTTATWLCVGADGANCDVANGTGDVDVTASIPVDASVTITLTATILPDAATGPLVNEATADLTSSVDPTPENNTDDHAIDIVPSETGPCSIFCDGFEGEDVSTARSAQKTSRGETALVVKVPALNDGVVQLFEVIGADGQPLAKMDVLASGSVRWFRLRYRDAAGAERFSQWSALRAGHVGFDWALGSEGLAIRSFSVGAGAGLAALLEAGRPLPKVLRSR